MWAFRMFDVDGDGVIDLDELTRIKRILTAHAIIVTALVQKFGFGTLDYYFGLRLLT